MYWFRDLNSLNLLAFALMTLMWLVGGWLLATHAFGMRRSEQLFSGVAIGFLLFIELSNLLAPGMPLTLAFWLATFLVLLAGILAGWHSSHHPVLDWHDLTSWGQWGAFILLLTVFTGIQRGLALFDEYLHMPLISVMATGDIPPHFYLNPSYYFAYHYGLQVYAASLVRQAGFFPWSAFDLCKALAIVLTLLLGWLWIRRFVRRPWVAMLGSFLLSFAGGTRWLLLLLPRPVLGWVSNGIALSNTGKDTAPTLLLALERIWVTYGSGKAQFPFAFHNGIFVPVIFVLGSTGAMPFMTILLLLLLTPSLARGSQPRLQKGIGWLAWTFIFATLALSAEHWFAFLWAGLALALMVSWLIQRMRPNAHITLTVPPATFRLWLAVLGASAILSMVQGGFITEVVRGFWLRLQGGASVSANAYGFSLRWPPTMLSAHLGLLTIFKPTQLIALLTELGPGLLLAPMSTRYAWKRYQDGHFLEAGLSLTAWISLIFSLFIQYGVDRSTTRLPSTALWLWLLAGIPMLWLAWRNWRAWQRWLGTIFLGSLVVGGIVIFGAQLSVIPSWQFTQWIQPIDTYISQDYWDRLPAQSQVFDLLPERSVIIFGRAARANQAIYEPLESWKVLAASLDPQKLAEAGYTYLYLDSNTWFTLSDPQREQLNQPCVKLIVNERWRVNVYRMLFDLRACLFNPASGGDGGN
jgi:hypothetical protein